MKATRRVFGTRTALLVLVLDVVARALPTRTRQVVQRGVRDALRAEYGLITSDRDQKDHQ